MTTVISGLNQATQETVEVSKNATLSLILPQSKMLNLQQWLKLAISMTKIASHVILTSQLQGAEGAR